MNRTVYDSQHGRTTCPRCRRPVGKCRCAAAPARPAGDGLVRVRREVRNGKPTTVVLGLPLDEADLRQLAQVLKKKCGSGGTAKDGCIEIQGDHRELVVAALTAAGHQVRLAGG